jgi:hypothetical protein
MKKTRKITKDNVTFFSWFNKAEDAKSATPVDRLVIPFDYRAMICCQLTQTIPCQMAHKG